METRTDKPAVEAPHPNGAESPTNQPPGPPSGSPARRGIVLTVIAVIAIAGAAFAFRAWRFGQSHVSTDDAFVTGNLVNVSPLIQGTLRELFVEEGSAVRKGQLIARLDDSAQQAALRQAEAALQAARTQVAEARSALRYQEASTAAGIRKAESAVAAQRAKTEGAEQQVTWASRSQQNQVAQSRGQVAAAEAQAEEARAQALTAQAGVVSAKQGIETADRAARAAEARETMARAESERTARDVNRYRSLADEQAISQQQFENVKTQAAAAAARLQEAHEELARARSLVSQAREAVTQAQAQSRASQQAESASREQVKVARAALGIAVANNLQVGIQQSNAASNREQTSQAQAELVNARAGSEQVALKRSQIDAADAQVKQAEAALANAKVALSHTLIYSPADGTVVKKTANVGVSLSPGQNIITITQGDHVWVTANFKETQLTHVRAGQPVEVEVDAFPGLVFQGRVESINEATGAVTSLLPPENATGNFTKVVQRIPIKIILTPAAGGDRRYARQEDIANLRQGMSVTATIRTSGS